MNNKNNDKTNDNTINSDINLLNYLIKLNSTTADDINIIISETQKYQNKLLHFYLDHIRNYKELTDQMLENINTIDDKSKMILIKEYNIVIGSINSILNDI